MTATRRVTPACLVQRYLFGVILDVIALELDELIESEPTQRLTLSRVLPSDPGQVLSSLVL